MHLQLDPKAPSLSIMHVQVEKKLLKAGVVLAPPPPKDDSDDEAATQRSRTMRHSLARQQRQRTGSDEDSDFN